MQRTMNTDTLTEDMALMLAEEEIDDEEFYDYEPDAPLPEFSVH